MERHSPFFMSKSNDSLEKVLVIDDDPNFCALIKRWLENGGYNVETFESPDDCFANLDRILPICICLDLNLPNTSGFDVLTKLKRLNRHLPVVMLTAESGIEKAVNAIRLGAYDYLEKPIDKVALLSRVKNATDKYRISLRLSQLEQSAKDQSFGGLIFESGEMKRLCRESEKVSASDVSVLIRGESGTGKELVAKGIHENSGRKDGAFVAINCAAIPSSLQESELFGHEKGSFTGASAKRKGRFELADGGTLFLDEVAELSLELQAKLLRVLQEKNFSRLGSSKLIESDFRLIAASHKNLMEETRNGNFREDLFYRIAVYELDIPALRDREGDVEVLMTYFLKKYGHSGYEIDADVLALLNKHPFPGNVRELENLVQRVLVSSEDKRITMNDLPRTVLEVGDVDERVEEKLDSNAESVDKPAVPIEEGLVDVTEDSTAVINEQEKVGFDFGELSLDEIEKAAIENAIEKYDGNMTKVTKHLGIGRTTLYRKLDKYGLRSGS